MFEKDEQAQLTESPELEEWLGVMGVAGSYIDFDGQDVPIPLRDRLAILRLMGECPGSQGELEKRLSRNKALSEENPLSTSALVSDQNWCIELNFHRSRLASSCRWQLRTETGEILSGELTGTELPETGSTGGEQQFSRRLWELPLRETGYHHLSIETHGKSRETLLICAPRRCHEPAWLLERQRLGGLSVQVYELCSARNWGIGDFRDLRAVIERAASCGVGFIVLNPLHALDLKKPEQCSPYSPMDRRYLNPLYLDLEAVPEFAHCEAARSLVASEGFQARLQQLRLLKHVDYSAVAEVKLQVLLLLFQDFIQSGDADTGRRREYERWIAGKGSALQAYAQFEAERHSECADARSEAAFHCYIQFLADEQLAQCQQSARAAGMAVGLVRDLAVGSTRDSAEVLLNPELFAVNASVGAPPDVFAPQGQNWGLPPIQPHRLANSEFAHFIELLSDNMQHCGALRIDHVMALMRLWWCPQHNDQGAGAYVRYPVDALFAILRLESERRSCVVIGEDLGVVPPEIRSHMNDSAVLSNLLFYFEKYDPVHFKKPEHYPERALAMVANHDVPTLRAWWDRTDIELRQQIGLLATAEEKQNLLGSRESDLIQILHWLQEQNLLPASWNDFNIHRRFDQELCAAILRANGRSASLLVSIQLADLVLISEPVNIPGTSSEYSNWRRKIPRPVDEVFTQADSLNILGAFIAARHGQG